jgi:protein O-GlcNAc transferase
MICGSTSRFRSFEQKVTAKQFKTTVTPWLQEIQTGLHLCFKAKLMLNWLRQILSAVPGSSRGNAIRNTDTTLPSVTPDEGSTSLMNQGDAYLKNGKLQEAAECYQKALAINPQLAHAHANLGYIFSTQGKISETIACYQKALAANPDFAIVYVNLGSILSNVGKLDEAIVCLQRALAINPDLVEAHYNLGLAFQGQGRFSEAVDSYRNAIQLRPDFAVAHNNLGNTYVSMGRTDEAESCFRKAVALSPSFADAHYNLGVLHIEQGKRLEAISCFRQTLIHEPDYHAARANLMHQLQHVCEWNELDSIAHSVMEAALSNTPVTPKTSLPLLAIEAMPGTTAAIEKICAEKFAQIEYSQLVPLPDRPGFSYTPRDLEKIRIGYLSSDFHDHATARLMAEIFELHDRNHFQITAYSYGPDDGSAMRARLESAFDQFIDIRKTPFHDAAEKVRADQIDILVDLKGYTSRGSSEILALRPAPIQVNYLGFPGTMGTDFVDYLIADRFIIPPEYRQYYTEKVMWMPDCYQPNDRTRPQPEAPTRTACNLPEEGFIFCCFNQAYKIIPAVFDVWCELLKNLPGSYLWLWLEEPAAEINLSRELKQRGVNPERLIKAPTIRSAPQHLARLQCADLFLDTFPCNAHTTCSDALWMGLPVITCAGDTFSSRVAGSLLTAIGAPELITYNLKDYYSLALDLARDNDKLRAVRNKILANRETSSLFDSIRFTRNLEALYSDMREAYIRNHAGTT